VTVLDRRTWLKFGNEVPHLSQTPLRKALDQTEQCPATVVDEPGRLYKREDCGERGQQLSTRIFNGRLALNRVKVVIPDHKTTRIHSKNVWYHR